MKPICATCGKVVLAGYFSSFDKGVRKDYHEVCVPKFYFFRGDET